METIGCQRVHGAWRNQAKSGGTKAIDIIVGLQACLDFEQGGDIAGELDSLYTFCTNRLALANALNDSTKIDDAYRVIGTIKAGWIEIGDGRA